MAPHRYVIVIEPPPGVDDRPRTLETRPLEPIEWRSILYLASELVEDGWTLQISKIPQAGPSGPGPT